MVLVFLLLIIVPVIAWLIAGAYRPNLKWTIAGITFGMIAFPFFNALSLLVLSTGLPEIGFILMMVLLLHMEPGHHIVVEMVGHRRLTGIEHLWMYPLNAIIFGIVYGMVGLFVDKNRKTSRGVDL